jgi:hypothetical protein
MGGQLSDFYGLWLPAAKICGFIQVFIPYSLPDCGVKRAITRDGVQNEKIFPVAPDADFTAGRRPFCLGANQQ